ncbi:MAG: ATP-binding protein [Chromatiales bacterium]|nr:ATP-binding protein [Chromatiales bacterium]
MAADQRASEVIGQVRAMLKKGEAQRQVLDINAIIREVSKLIHSDLITRQVSLVMTLDTTLPGVTGDPIQLQQVILNLLLNGAEALLVSASRPRQLEIRTTRRNAATIEVSVHDTGVGIDPQQLEHIFEPFVTTKPTAWGWDWPSAARLLPPTGVGCGRRTIPMEGRPFTSPCRSTLRPPHAEQRPHGVHRR